MARPLGCAALEYPSLSTAPLRPRGGHMRARTVQTWIARPILVRLRLENVCTSYLLFLMVATRKHSLEEAARFSGRHKSQFSKMLKAHSKVAVSTLESLPRNKKWDITPETGVTFSMTNPNCLCVPVFHPVAVPR